MTKETKEQVKEFNLNEKRNKTCGNWYYREMWVKKFVKIVQNIMCLKIPLKEKLERLRKATGDKLI